MSCPFCGRFERIDKDTVCVMCDGEKRLIPNKENSMPLRCDWISYHLCEHYKVKNHYCPFYNGCENYGRHAILCCSIERIKSYNLQEQISICTGNYFECDKYKEEIKMQELQTQAIDTLELHEKQIINQCRIQAQSIVETGKILKAIKDGKEYTAKGFDSFTAYMDDACSSIFPFRNGQAYKYIRVYEAYGPRLEQYGTMSLDVLDMFRDVAPDEFEEVAKELEGMSVKEAEELKKKLEAANQQISLLTDQVEKHKEIAEKSEQDADKISDKFYKIEDERNKLENENSKLKKEISDLANKPIDVAVAEPSQEQLDKIKAEIESKYKAEAENIKSGYEQKLEKLNKKLDKEKTVADEKTKELEKKLQNAGKADEELIEFKFYFTSVQENLKKFLEVLGKIEDPEKKAKYKGAAKQFMDAIMADIEGA